MNWKPTDPLFVEFETHTASVQDVEEMIARMRSVAEEFGVDISWFGKPELIQRYLKKPQEPDEFV